MAVPGIAGTCACTGGIAELAGSARSSVSDGILTTGTDGRFVGNAGIDVDCGIPGTLGPRCASANAPPAGGAKSGRAVKTSLAIRVKTSGSRSPAVTSLPGSLVLMIVSEFDIIERGNRVIDEHRGGAIQRNQIRRQRVIADAHEAHRQPRCLFARQPGLK
jgi:hypothetical protein